MNIALFPSAYFPSLGGVEELSRQLALELRGRGHGVIVVCNRWPRDLPEHESLDGIEVYRLPMRYPGGSFKSHVSYHLTHSAIRRSVVKLLERCSIDIVHVQCVSTQSVYALSASRTLGRPSVVTLQGELSMDADGVYSRPGRAQDLMRATLLSADAVSACSQQTLDEAGRFLGTPFPAPASVIYNGVKVSEIRSAEAFEHPRPYVLAIGRHVRQKGFDVLIEAFATVARTNPCLDLILAGDGPEHASLRALADRIVPAGRAHFPGRTDRAATARLFRGCMCFVLPSRHEPFGIVNLEAMSAAKPVIATRVGGVPEIVHDGVNGLLVEPENASKIAAAITRLVTDPSLAARLAERASTFADAFDWRVIADQYLAVYGALASGRPVATSAKMSLEPATDPAETTYLTADQGTGRA